MKIRIESNFVRLSIMMLSLYVLFAVWRVPFAVYLANLILLALKMPKTKGISLEEIEKKLGMS